MPGETITITEIVEVPGETITVTEVVEVPGATTVVTETITTVVEVPVQFVKFNESPLLAQRVQGGLLPPVEERLPEEPMVIPVVEEIGRYGGTLRRGHLGYSDRFGWARYNRSGLVRWAYDGTTMIPTLAKGWETSKDGKEWTFFLRERNQVVRRRPVRRRRLRILLERRDPQRGSYPHQAFKLHNRGAVGRV